MPKYWWSTCISCKKLRISCPWHLTVGPKFGIKPQHIYLHMFGSFTLSVTGSNMKFISVKVMLSHQFTPTRSSQQTVWNSFSLGIMLKIWHFLTYQADRFYRIRCSELLQSNLLLHPDADPRQGPCSPLYGICLSCWGGFHPHSSMNQGRVKDFVSSTLLLYHLQFLKFCHSVASHYRLILFP